MENRELHDTHVVLSVKTDKKSFETLRTVTTQMKRGMHGAYRNVFGTRSAEKFSISRLTCQKVKCRQTDEHHDTILKYDAVSRQSA